MFKKCCTVAIQLDENVDIFLFIWVEEGTLPISKNPTGERLIAWTYSPTFCRTSFRRLLNLVNNAVCVEYRNLPTCLCGFAGSKWKVRSPRWCLWPSNELRVHQVSHSGPTHRTRRHLEDTRVGIDVYHAAVMNWYQMTAERDHPEQSFVL